MSELVLVYLNRFRKKYEEVYTLIRVEKFLAEKHIVCGGFANKFVEKNNKYSGGEKGQEH